MGNNEEIRLRIVEAVLPNATRHGFSDPDKVVEICSRLENYVVSSKPKDSGNLSDPQPSRRKSRPPKETTETVDTSKSVDPTNHGG